jgi:Fe-S cluster assembly iron-binding protein IscA
MTETATETLVFTDAAARKVGDLILGEGNPNLKLRVFVQGVNGGDNIRRERVAIVLVVSRYRQVFV